MQKSSSGRTWWSASGWDGEPAATSSSKSADSTSITGMPPRAESFSANSANSGTVTSTRGSALSKIHSYSASARRKFSPT